MIYLNASYNKPASEKPPTPPVKPLYDASYALLVGIDAPNGLLTYPIHL